MTFTLYSQLKQQIVLGVASSEKPNQILTKLKESYRNQINSPRKYEQIDSVGQLLITLEKRDLLSENNVEILKEIAQSLFNRDLISKINDYENNHQPTEYLNYYAPDNVKRSSSNKVPFMNVTNKNPYTYLTPNKKDRIHLTIVEQIGTHWRDLARNLKIGEHLIDKIDQKYSTLDSKASNMLEIYYNDPKTDPQKWLLSLCNALERARRKDLSRTIQEILAMSV